MEESKNIQSLLDIEVEGIEAKELEEPTYIPTKEGFQAQLGKDTKFEATCKSTKMIRISKGRYELPTQNGFMESAKYAFEHHQKFTLNPSDLWLLILQGFSHHINIHHEDLREKIVDFDGSMKLRVDIPEFIYGDPNNPWEEVFPQFSDKIREFVGEELHDAIQSTFSTTGSVEQAAADISLMSCFQKYFTYSCMTSCGIPGFRLLGTLDDWLLLIDKTHALIKYDLDWWISPLLEILNVICDTIENQGEGLDIEFWSSFYKYLSSSGTENISGWIVNFFPYVGSEGDLKPNSSLLQWNSYEFIPFYKRGVPEAHIPLGLSKAPVLWNYLGKEINLQFVAGFVGTGIDSDKYIKPLQSWAIIELD